MKKKTRIGILAVAFILVILVGIWVSSINGGTPTVGSKEISVEILNEGSVVYIIKTEEENLRGALEQEDLIQGEESDFGLFVKTVDGYTVNEGKQEWWAFYSNGESLMTGVDDTIISDGDVYKIELTEGY